MSTAREAIVEAILAGGATSVAALVRWMMDQEEKDSECVIALREQLHAAQVARDTRFPTTPTEYEGVGNGRYVCRFCRIGKDEPGIPVHDWEQCARTQYARQSVDLAERVEARNVVLKGGAC